MNRIIGIRHRIKRAADGEMRPTQLAILEGGAISTFDLATEQDELDFINGNYSPKKGVTLGLRTGDCIAMGLGGSGDLLAFALSVKAEALSAKVMRVPPFKLQNFRAEASKDDDAVTLANYGATKPEDFYVLSPRDRKLIELIEAFRARIEAMKARIGCEQRLRQYFIGRTMLGIYPQGEIEKQFDNEKANYPILQALVAEEKRRDSELARAATQVDVYCQVFAPVEGVGPATAARIISAVGDIRRFWVLPDEAEMVRLYDESHSIQSQYFDPIEDKIASQFTSGMTIWDKLGVAKSHYNRLGNTGAVNALQMAMDLHQRRSCLKRQAQDKGINKFRAFCGVHILRDGRFPRRRNNEVANWHPDARQGLYLLGDQFVKRADSDWGKRYRAVKARYHDKHPEVITVDGKKRYTDGHLHKMAIWATIGEFAEYIFVEWSKLYE